MIIRPGEKIMNKENIKICASCGGNVEIEKTTFTLDFESSILIVRGVPAFVCSVCGDKWYSDAVSDRLDEFVTEARNTYKKLHDDVIITRFDEVA